MANPSCLRLLVYEARRAASRAAWTAGKRRAISTARMAMTTSSSISVKPPRRAETLEMGLSRDVTRLLEISEPVMKMKTTEQTAWETTGRRQGTPIRRRGTDFATSTPQSLALGLLGVLGDARRNLEVPLHVPAVPTPLG